MNIHTDYATYPDGQTFRPDLKLNLKELCDRGFTVKHSPGCVVVAHLCLIGECYVMTNGNGGTHRLAVAATDEARLAAHWEGFCETSLAISEGRIWRRGI